VLVQPQNTGQQCPALEESRSCNLRKCDCGVTEWGDYGICDVPCGGGKSYRSRDIFREPLLNGLQCPAVNESRSCNTKPCARVGLPPVPARVKKMLHEQKAELFTMVDKSLGGWCYQEAGELSPYSYGYVGNEGGVWFSGDSTNRTSMRTHHSFGTDSGDLFVQAEISKNSECSNHFIVLSADPYYRWNWEQEPGTYKFVWQCGEKKLISPAGEKSVQCTELRNYKLSISVGEDEISFKDDVCDEIRIRRDNEEVAKDLFLYIGANYVDNSTGTEAAADQTGVDADDSATGAEGAAAATTATAFLDMSIVARARAKHTRRLRAAPAADTTNCGSEVIPWKPVECSSITGAVTAEGGNNNKCLVSSAALIKLKNGREYFDGSAIQSAVTECQQRDDCVGIQQIVHAPTNPGRYALVGGYDMAIAPDTGTQREASFCPKVGAEEIIKLMAEDKAVREGTADDDEDGGDGDDDLPEDDRRPAPGWTPCTLSNLEALPVQVGDDKYEYRFKKGNAWYISPPTAKIWDWDSFATVTGTWTYGDEDGNTGDFDCQGGIDLAAANYPACGLGCTTGTGNVFQVTTRCSGAGGVAKDEGASTVTVCQSKPNAFGSSGKVPKCVNEVHVSFHKIVTDKLSAADAAEKKQKELLAKQKEEEDLLLDGESSVADEALATAETPPENAEDQSDGEPNRAVFKMLRVSGQDSVTNRIKGSGVCPAMVDCQFTDFGEWSNCSLPCDGGESTRNRTVLAKPEYGGKQCPALTETKTCNTRECDCGVTPFSEWSECSAECGGGTKERGRSVFRVPLGDGELCPELNESKTCNTEECAVLGLPSLGVTDTVIANSPRMGFPTLSQGDPDTSEAWCFERQDTLMPYEFNFSKGEGVWFKGDAEGKTSMRSKQTFRLPLRLDISFLREERCSNHFVVLSTDPYYVWSGPEQEPGTIKFFYDCDTRRASMPSNRASPDANKAGVYEGRCARHVKPQMETTIELPLFSKPYFEDNVCGRVDLNFRDVIENFAKKNVYLYIGAARPVVPWVDKGKTLFTSVRVSGNGSLPLPVNASDPGAYDFDTCPKLQDCKVTPWEEWSQCTAPCNGGNHTRTRKVTKRPAFKGKECPELFQEAACNTQHCGTDCVVTEFSEWGNCTKVCGGGTSTRTREIFKDLLNGTLYGHEQCPALSETRECNTQHCGVDCVVTDWAPWSACSAPCGGGGRKRVRSVLVQPIKGSHHGKECPHLEETEPCNQQMCPVHEGPTPILESKCQQMNGMCSECTADPDCGYCPSTGQCYLGDPEGPLPRFEGDTSFLTDPQKYFMYLTNCSSYQFAFCAQTPCEGYNTCGKCLADSFCGWCAGSGKCAEGDAAGSFQEFCPRGWVHSPMHAGVGVRHRSDLLLTARQVAAERDRLGDFCEANTEEQRRAIQEKMEDENTRQERLRRLQESCAPCTGVWPNCQCEPSAFPVQLRPLAEEQVARAAGTEEATGVKDGTELKVAGLQCMLDEKCESGTCVERCCKDEVNGCNGHGSCDEKGDCACEEGWTGTSCDEKVEEKVAEEEVDDSAKLAEETKKREEAEAKRAEEEKKAAEKEERSKSELAAKKEEAKKEAERLEEAEKEAERLEEAEKAGDAEAATKLQAKEEEIVKQKSKEEETKRAKEEAEKAEAEEATKRGELAPAPEVEEPMAAPAATLAASPATGATGIAEDGEAKVAALMVNLTKPGADVPKIAQSIITVSYNNSANKAEEEAQTLEEQRTVKYDHIVEEKARLEKMQADLEGIQGKIKSNEVEEMENRLAAEKVVKAEQLVKENAEKLRIAEAAQSEKAKMDEEAAEAKAEMAKLEMQKETEASKAAQKLNEAEAQAKVVAQQTTEMEDKKKKETALALERDQAVSDLKALHTKTEQAQEGAKKAELEKSLSDTETTQANLDDTAASQVADKAQRADVTNLAKEVATAR
jgi:hypothetical protein